jgi:hypothetical protein
MFRGHLRITGPVIFPKLADAWGHRLHSQCSYAEFRMSGKVFQKMQESGIKCFAVARDKAGLAAALRADVRLPYLRRSFLQRSRSEPRLSDSHRAFARSFRNRRRRCRPPA